MQLNGDLTYSTVMALKSAVPEAEDDGVATIDLTRVTNVDSAGLALILYWAGVLDRRGERVKLVGASAKISHLLDLIGMADKLTGR